MKAELKILFVFVFAVKGLFAQSVGINAANSPLETKLPDVYTIVEEMPEPAGGINTFYQYVSSHIIYPQLAKEDGIQGKVFVKFVVETDGSLSDIRVLKGIERCVDCDNEAIRVVKSYTEKWMPGKQNGIPVRVYYTLPIAYKVLGRNPIAESNESKLSPEQRLKHERAMVQWNDGHQFEQNFDFARALEKFEKTLSIEPDNKYALFDKGKMLMVLGQKDEACRTWNKLIADSIRKDEASEFVKKYCGNSEGVDEMVKYYKNIKASGFFDAGLGAVSDKRYEAAIRKFDSCLKYNPTHKDALFNKGVMHFKLDQKNAACASWKKLRGLKPDDKQTEDLIKKHCN